mgnify:CR=1 FL=1
MFRRIQRLRQSGIEVYPARVNRSHTVQQVQETEAAKCTSVIAGRLVGLDLKVGRARLKDWSGTIDLALVTQKLSEILPLLSEGDLVECTGTWSQEIYNVTAVRMLVPSLRKAPEPDATNAVCIRASLLAQTRLFFEARGFLHVETPTLMTVPDLTPELRSFRTNFEDDKGGSYPLYLQTSPEHYMKRLLAAGCERIYQICRFYRNGERYHTHHPEFTGLEWYEAFTDYKTVMRTTEAYIISLAETLDHSGKIYYQGLEIDLQPPWPRYRVRDLFLAKTGIDLNECESRDKFAAAAEDRGYEVQNSDSWDDLFHRIFLNAVEPNLPTDRPIFLTEYPSQLPSLARHVPGDSRYVERFELYMGGLELANAFTELNDPEEQRRRFKADLQMKQRQENYGGGIDEAMLAALEFGMPPSGGIAFGLDRLAMIFADVHTIDSIIMFRNH